MTKLIIYFRYFFEYIKHGDLVSVISAIKYVLFRTSHSHDRLITTSIGEFFCRKNTNDFQFANYGYEWSVKQFILEQRKEHTVFIDGGACVGGYTILLARLGLPCLAFEPMLSTYEILVKNVELNNLSSKVRVYPYGLGDENKRLDFIFDPVNTGASHYTRDNGPGDCLANIRTFDSIFPELSLGLDEKILFKLDIEGMEPEAIRGAKEFILLYPNLTFVMEDKHSGGQSIKKALSSIAPFEFGIVDQFNIYARKIKNV
ncbi:MAG: FkbM family methyltransferase [Bacteroidetes bacterium]|nr:FkbM family methyltransferase [Bacteroidota bacterium]